MVENKLLEVLTLTVKKGYSRLFVDFRFNPFGAGHFFSVPRQCPETVLFSLLLRYAKLYALPLTVQLCEDISLMNQYNQRLLRTNVAGDTQQALAVG